jgi:hypothetical protein
LSNGYCVRPTIFADVTNDMTIAREEIFGPVLSILSYRDEDDALPIANDTTYGLHANIFSTDVERAPPCVADPGGTRGHQWRQGTAVSVWRIQAVGDRAGIRLLWPGGLSRTEGRDCVTSNNLSGGGSVHHRAEPR